MAFDCPMPKSGSNIQNDIWVKPVVLEIVKASFKREAVWGPAMAMRSGVSRFKIKERNALFIEPVFNPACVVGVLFVGISTRKSGGRGPSFGGFRVFPGGRSVSRSLMIARTGKPAFLR